MATFKQYAYQAGKCLKTKSDMLAVAVAPFLPMVFSSAMAQDLQSKINTYGGNIYSLILGITSVTGGTALAICFYLMLFSKNGKTVEEATSWAKRIVVCWVAIGLIGAITQFINTKLSSGITGGLTNQGVSSQTPNAQ